MKKQKTHLDKTKPVALAIALLILGSLQGCMFYYKVKTVTPVTPNDIKTYDTLNKYLILHQRDKAWHFSQPLISDSTLYCKLSVLPEYRYKFQAKKPKGTYRYIKRTESYLLEEVHLYISDSVVPDKYDSGSIKIAFSKIQNAEIYFKAKGRTIVSWGIPAFLGTVVLTSGIVAVIGLTSMNFHLSP